MLVLTLLILMYPIRLQLQYGSVQSLQVIENPIIFSGLFISLISICFIFLVFEKNEIARVLVIIIMSVVFLGFWTIGVYNGTTHDQYVNLGIVNYILGGGSFFTRDLAMLYLNFPALHILGAEASLIFGTSIFEIAYLLSLAFTIVFTLEIYVFFRSLLKNETGTIVAAILAIFGNLIWLHFQAFIPTELGYILLMAILICLAQRREKLIYLFWPVLVMAYFPASLFCLLLLIILGLMGRFSKTSGLKWALPYCLIVFFSWNIYWSNSNFSQMVSYLRYFLSIGQDLGWFSQISGIVSKVPLWVTGIEYFWFVFLIGLGSIIALNEFRRIKKLDWGTQLLLSGLIGTIIFGLFSAFAFPGGVQWTRFFYYSPIFCAPLIASFFLKKMSRKSQLTFIAFILIFLALPSFLMQS